MSRSSRTTTRWETARLGDRINMLAKPEALRAITEIFLLSPAPPLIFMGQEFMADSPFPFFSDLSPELAPAISDGRLKFFIDLPMFKERYNLDDMPDPSDERTFQSAILDFKQLSEPEHALWHKLHKKLIEIRKREIVPRLKGVKVDGAGFEMQGDSAFKAWWTLNDGSMLTLVANLGAKVKDVPAIPGLSAAAPDEVRAHRRDERRAVMPPWSVAWFLGK